MTGLSRIIDRGKENLTERMHFLYGSYISNGTTVPYLLSALTYKQVNEYLKLFENMHDTGYNWEIKDLIQRQIDWTRVDNDLIKYLDSNKPVFFNGITVILMPRGSSELTVKFNDANPEQTDNKLVIGPVHLHFYSEEIPKPGTPEFESGQFVWNRDEVIAVAIDGQHRVASIQELMKRNTSAQAEVDPKEGSRVPVMFLLFDEKVGYTSVSDYKGIEIVRSIFLDLNSHAVHVPRTRQILLDDVQLRSLFVKNVIATKMHDDLSPLTGKDKRLPLSLIDWHTEYNKIDNNPYLTTITLLDSIMNIITGLKPNDYSDYESTLDCLKKICDNEIDMSSLDKIYKKYEEAEERNTQFVFSDDERNSFVAMFNREVKPVLIGLLTKYKPYKDFCDKRLSLGTLSYNWQTWYPLYIDSQQPLAVKAKDKLRDFELRLSRDNSSDFSTTEYVNKVDSCNSYKGTPTHLPFKTVFQKTLFKSYTQFSTKVNSNKENKVSNYIKENIDIVANNENKILGSGMFDTEIMEIVDFESIEEMSGSYKEKMKKICLFIYIINKLYAKCSNVFSYDYSFIVNDNYDNDNERNVFFWQGSFYNKDSDTIDHNKSAVDRSSDLFTLMILIAYINDICPGVDFNDLWRTITDPSCSNELLKDCDALIKKLSKMEGRSPSLVGRIFKNLDIEISGQNNQRAADEIKIRIEHIWNHLQTL